MLKLIKYNIKKSRVIFGVLIGVYVLLMLLQVIGINLGVNLGVKSKYLYDSFETYTGICKFVLMVYACNEIYKDVCTRADILANTIPISDIKRFFAKYLTYCLYYLVFQFLSVIFYFLNDKSIYSFFIDIITNYKDYIIHDIIGSILFYPANVAIISTATIIISKLIRNQSVIAVLIVVVLILQVVGINSGFDKFVNGNSKLRTKLVIDNIRASKNIGGWFSYPEALSNIDGNTATIIELDFRMKTFRLMSGMNGQYSMGASTTENDAIENLSKYFKLPSLVWMDIIYSVVCMFIALIICAACIKWKGINN